MSKKLANSSTAAPAPEEATQQKKTRDPTIRVSRHDPLSSKVCSQLVLCGVVKLYRDLPDTAGELSRAQLRVERELLEVQRQDFRRLLEAKSSRRFHLRKAVKNGNTATTKNISLVIHTHQQQPGRMAAPGTAAAQGSHTRTGNNKAGKKHVHSHQVVSSRTK